MVRKPQVEPAAVNVELLTEVAGRHGRALDVPAGAASAPRRGPRGAFGLMLAIGLPEREVAGVALACSSGRVAVCRVFHLLAALLGERAVLGPARRVEVDARGAVERLIGVATLDEQLDERHHLGDVRGRPRLVGRSEHSERVIGRGEVSLDAVGERPPLLAAAGLGGDPRVIENLVVDISDVANQRDPVTRRGEPAPNLVVGERAAQVADVRRRLHGRAADIDAHFAANDRVEVDDGLLPRVVDALFHGTSLGGERPRRDCVTDRAGRSSYLLVRHRGERHKSVRASPKNIASSGDARTLI